MNVSCLGMIRQARFFGEVPEHSETESACGKQLGNGRDAGLLAILP